MALYFYVEFIIKLATSLIVAYAVRINLFLFV